MAKTPHTITIKLGFTPTAPGSNHANFVAHARLALRAWEKVCNVKFVEKSAGAAVSVVAYSSNVNIEYTIGSHGHGVIKISTTPRMMKLYTCKPNGVFPDSCYCIMIHALGHILGLGDYVYGGHPKSVMNYGPRPTEPGPEDISKVQRIWGKP